MIPVLALYGMVGLVLVVWGSRLGRAAFLVGALPPAVSVILVSWRLGDITAGRVVADRATWVVGLGLSLDLRLDGLAATMTLIVAGVGVLVMVYAASYFPAGSPDLGRLAGLLVLFAGAMVGLVQADHLLVLYTCWELTTITSYLLIGNRHTDVRARAAALHALAATGTGGLALLGGLVLLGNAAGTYRLGDVLAAPLPDGPALTAAILLLLLGAFTKSAQYPFHAWLPGAMIAPTPVSAYLHSATMVKAGVYLVAVFAPVFAETAVWRPAVLAVGGITLVAGGLRALRQHDLKLLLAFGTVSQLGLMMMLFGAGTPAATTAGWVLIVAHALFKAALFMVVGILDRRTGTRDIRELPALDHSWWRVRAVTAVSAASMAGVPLLAGFVAKEAAYTAFADAPFVGSVLVLAMAVGGSMLTAAYSWRFYRGAFGGAQRRARPAPRSASSAAPATASPASSPWRLEAPAIVLAAGSVVLGVAPGVADQLVTVAVGAADGAVHLALWHGWNVPLALSVLTLTGGALLAVADRGVQRVLATGAALPSGQLVHLSLLRLLQTVSRGVTAVTQNGSLPVYSGVILSTAAAFPLVALIASWRWPGWPPLGALGDVPAAALLVVSALGAASVRSRFAAAVFLSVAGYAMAALFVSHGAPDLALTQAVVETLSTVVFVLVLRWLPERFERQSSPRRRVGRLAIAGLVGVTVFVFALVLASSDLPSAVSAEMIARAEPDGHGKNVVNVILVDFRALDTLGEITVLAAASIGAVALARAGRRAATARGEMFTSGPAARVHRIVFVDVSVRVIFHAVLMMSLWLLFAGHNQPGGGFVGGLLAGSAITLRYIAGGMDEVRAGSRLRPWTVMGSGLLLAAATAAAPLLTGGAVLEVLYRTVSLPVIGEFSLSSALVFDAGVYITVLGMVLMALEAFGDEPVEVPR